MFVFKLQRDEEISFKYQITKYTSSPVTNNCCVLFTFLSHLDFALLSKNSDAPAPALAMNRRR